MNVNNMNVEVAQSCPTLCDPIDGSPLGSPEPGILHARMLEWVAISFSNAWKWKVKVKSLSRITHRTLEKYQKGEKKLSKSDVVPAFFLW